jgi:hypothetical protein
MAAMRTSAIIEQMKQGAKLHRELDRVELRLLDGGKFLVPAAWLDALSMSTELLRRVTAFSGCRKHAPGRGTDRPTPPEKFFEPDLINICLIEYWAAPAN